MSGLENGKQILMNVYLALLDRAAPFLFERDTRNFAMIFDTLFTSAIHTTLLRKIWFAECRTKNTSASKKINLFLTKIKTINLGFAKRSH